MYKLKWIFYYQYVIITATLVRKYCLIKLYYDQIMFCKPMKLQNLTDIEKGPSKSTMTSRWVVREESAV